MSDLLPNFLIIGAPRSGTTYLYRCLAEHPDVFMPVKKEINFFTDGWHQGTEWYERYFDAHDGETAIGEASVSYTATGEVSVAERIASVLPDIRLIYLLRNPVERVWSHYVFMNRSIDGDERTFDEVGRGHIESSRYAEWIRRYLEHFERDQILVLTYEELTSKPEELLPTVFRFIGVEPSFQPEVMTKRVNASYEPKRKRLLRAYRRLVATSWYKKLSSSQLRRTLQQRLPTKIGRSWNWMRRVVGMQQPPAMPTSLRLALSKTLSDDRAQLEILTGRSYPEWGER